MKNPLTSPKNFFLCTWWQGWIGSPMFLLLCLLENCVSVNSEIAEVQQARRTQLLALFQQETELGVVTNEKIQNSALLLDDGSQCWMYLDVKLQKAMLDIICPVMQMTLECARWWQPYWMCSVMAAMFVVIGDGSHVECARDDSHIECARWWQPCWMCSVVASIHRSQSTWSYCHFAKLQHCRRASGQHPEWVWNEIKMGVWGRS